MRRVTSLFLCAILLGTPGLALGTCSMGPGTGIEAACCCAASCACPAAGQGAGRAADSSLGQCSGDHSAGMAPLISGVLVNATLELRSGLALFAVAHPAAAQDATASVAGHLTLEPDRSALATLHRQAFELFCTLLI